MAGEEVAKEGIECSHAAEMQHLKKRSCGGIKALLLGLDKRGGLVDDGFSYSPR
jgi:hypothetical protein